MKITAIEITNFKRIREVKLAPSADAYLLLIGGKNAQGKTSLLDALSSAFGGGRAIPPDPVRHGADKAEIRIELDGGDLVVRRKIADGGAAQLEVREADGAPIKNPQERLTALVGKSFLDPLAFLQLKEADQRARLLELIPEAEQLADLDRKRETIFEKRTEVNRQKKHAEGELARMPEPPAIAEVDVGAIYNQIGEIKGRSLAGDQAAARATAAGQAYNRTLSHVEQLRAQLARAETELEEVKRERDHAVQLADATAAARQVANAELHTLQLEAEAADIANRKAREIATQRAQVAKARAELEALTKRSDNLTAAIDEIEAEKTATLAAAKLPVVGLGFNDQGVLFQGVPLVQASGAQRLRVALALAIAARPQLRDVWIRDGALLDDESLVLVADQAREAGVRVWIERVGDDDEGAIVISDGALVPLAVARWKKK